MFSEKKKVKYPEEDYEINGNSRIGGQYSRSKFQQRWEAFMAGQKVDFRYDGVNTPVLDKKFAKELSEGERLIEQREPHSWKTKFQYAFNYDYDKDRVFQEFLRDREEARQALHNLWVDEVLDDLHMFIAYVLRVYTTIGALYGLGKTIHLWRKIDRNYTKLHGVTFLGTAAWEVALNVLYSGGHAALFVLSFYYGEIAFKLGSCFTADDVRLARRNTGSLTLGATMSGALVTVPYMWYGKIAPMYKMAITVVSAIGHGSVGYYIGKYIYDPWISKYGHYDDRPWVPWHKKSLASPLDRMNIRGRYV